MLGVADNSQAKRSRIIELSRRFEFCSVLSFLLPWIMLGWIGLIVFLLFECFYLVVIWLILEFPVFDFLVDRFYVQAAGI